MSGINQYTKSEYDSLREEFISILSHMESELDSKLGEVIINRSIRMYYYRNLKKVFNKIYNNYFSEIVNDSTLKINKYFKSPIFPQQLIENLEINFHIYRSGDSERDKELSKKNIKKIFYRIIDIYKNPPYVKSLNKCAANIYNIDKYNLLNRRLNEMLNTLSNKESNELWVLSDKEKTKYDSIDNIEEKNNFYSICLNKKIYKILNKIKRIRPGEVFKETNDNDDSFIKIKDLNKIYSSKDLNVHVIKNLSLTIKKGEFVLLLGPSGSGKTTLMNMIAGIDDVSYGHIIVNGIDIGILDEDDLTVYRKNNVGYVFQRYALIPNLTVEENIRIGGYISNRINNKNFKGNYIMPEKELDDLLNQLGLLDLKNKYPYQLSGGQQQRVAIARTIAKKPSIIFADEPTSALDENSTKAVIDMLKNINEKLGITIIMITHNEKETSFASRIVKMKNGNLE